MRRTLRALGLWAITGILLSITSCAKDDDSPEEDPFYGGALTTATAAMLEGNWSIYEVEFEGQKAAVPQNDQNCSRDFFTFSENKNYTEYAVQDQYECIPQIQTGKWELSDGVITLSQSISVREEYVVTELSDSRLSFKIKVDVDDDGKLDIVSALCRKYTPPVEMDLYSYSFGQDLIGEGSEKIKFTWRPYEGYNEFTSYEIYRSDESCSKNDADLIATITDQNQSFFIDESPAIQEELCYFFRLKTSSGTLSESDLATVNTNYIEVPRLQLATPQVDGQKISLNWEKFKGSYFSHYELVAQISEAPGIPDETEITVAKITDINTTSYLDADPPYMQNPIYTVFAVNIFGNRGYTATLDKNSRRVTFTREGLLELQFIEKSAIDPDEPVVYLYGRGLTGNDFVLQRYNYSTHSIEAQATHLPGATTSFDMKIIKSAYGKELIFHQQSGPLVYNAQNLEYKYSLDFGPDYFIFGDYEMMTTDFWAISNSKGIFTASRKDSILTILDTKSDFINPSASPDHTLAKINNTKMLIDKGQEQNSYLYTLNANGTLTLDKRPSISIALNPVKKTFYNTASAKFYDLNAKTIYNPGDLSVFKIFSNPQYATGISNDGTLILGTNNDPERASDADFAYAKKIQLYNINTGTIEERETKGFPHLVFENKSGKIVSISSQFKQAKLSAYSPAANMFVEIID